MKPAMLAPAAERADRGWQTAAGGQQGVGRWVGSGGTAAQQPAALMQRNPSVGCGTRPNQLARLEEPGCVANQHQQLGMPKLTCQVDVVLAGGALGGVVNVLQVGVSWGAMG